MEERTELPMLSGKSSTTTPSPRSLGVFGIFREAFSVLAANGKVMASIILLVIIPYQILAVVEKLTFTPLAKDLHSKLTLLKEYPIGSPLRAKILDELKHDSRVLLGVTTTFLLILIILALFSLAAAASASTMSYSRKKFSLMELLLKVKGTWKKPVVTWFYIFLVAVAYCVLALLLFGIVAATTHGRSLILLSTAMLLFAVLASVYLAAVWTLALVVSVNEEDTCGMKAITRAEELIKGRKTQGFLLKFLLSITAGLGIILLSRMRVGVLKYSGGLISVASVVGICLIALLKFFTFVVVTVFYHECKKDEVDKSGEEKMVKVGFVYSSVPSGEV
ncbi:hypothetical protein H6P81_000540 [Aristolochia fimbriata]|uniref:Uncharacterized protein n=1 Tax=Aristolochia fimbriata TaxID=158543 RepID=A0AAV7F8C1_ARIFI|nr:hypothetical protein H6P81_000540 [Aristolochia fimbriata]